jgi:hypothetical protein
VDEVARSRERLRFVEFDFERLPNGQCRSRVTLEWDSASQFVGTEEGLASEAGELRCAAQAALNAIEEAAEGILTFELLGVKAVRACDTSVLIVSLVSQFESKSVRLVGSFLAEERPERGAAVAVLNATNRLLGNIFLRDAR